MAGCFSIMASVVLVLFCPKTSGKNGFMNRWMIMAWLILLKSLLVGPHRETVVRCMLLPEAESRICEAYLFSLPFEQVIYINGRPFVLRDEEKPLSNLELTVCYAVKITPFSIRSIIFTACSIDCCACWFCYCSVGCHCCHCFIWQEISLFMRKYEEAVSPNYSRAHI